MTWSEPWKSAGRGRLLQSNPNTAMARSFSCGLIIEICQAEISAMTDNWNYASTVQYGTISPQECLNSCSGSPVANSFNGFRYGWSSYNLNIASISGSGSNQSVNLYGAGVGSTNIVGFAQDAYCTAYTEGPATVAPTQPTISAVSPLVYGQSGPLSISGSGFSSFVGPITISFTNSGITGSGTVTNGGLITGTYNVGCGVPLSEVNEVWVNGGWADGSLASLAYPVSVNLPTVSMPTISLAGTPVSGTQSVVVGQQIALTASQPLPNCMTLQSSNWSQPQGTAVGGYTASSTTGSVQAVPPLNTPTFTYYWTAPGSSLTESYASVLATTSGDGLTESGPLVTASFNVTGPSATFPSIPTGNVGIFAGPVLGFGPTGIQFSPSTSTPSGDSGQFEWVQLITNDAYTMTTTSGAQKACVNVTQPTQNPNGTGLDSGFPFASGTSTLDSPMTALDSTQYLKEARSFPAQMYLLWDPALPAGCTLGKTCTSIPIPLGSVIWGWSGAATYSAPNWTLTSSSSTTPSWTSGSSYPTSWPDYVPYKGQISCH